MCEVKVGEVHSVLGAHWTATRPSWDLLPTYSTLVCVETTSLVNGKELQRNKEISPGLLLHRDVLANTES